MAIEVIRRSDQQRSSWSGGTTTQLAIWPPGSSYRQRNFLFRLSSATIETEQSEFTSLPGVTRHIMLLEGALELIHDGRYKKLLLPFGTNTFDGAWKTASRGKATDFNLMTKGHAKGSLEHIRLMPAEDLDLRPETDDGFLAVYIVNGEVTSTVAPDDFSFSLHQGDLILLSPGNSSQSIKLSASMATDLVIAKMRIPKHTYHHVGIPTNDPKENEEYLPKYKIHHSGFETSKFGIEWMRYEEGCTMPEIVKNIPHVAFEVDDMYEAVKGQKILIEPNSPSEGVIVALIEENGAPVELLQYVKKIEN